KNYQFRKQYGFNPFVPDLYGYGQTIHTSIAKLHQTFKNNPPTKEEAEIITRETFHLKHVPPAKNPNTNPGPYERAIEKAVEVVSKYANDYGNEFSLERQIEVRFEIPANQALITGAIDLLIKEDKTGKITDATVVDFKSLEKPDDDSVLDWTELSIQVQLYAKAAIDILGQNAKTGAVHLLRSNERINIPIDENSIKAAISNIEWAVDRILNRDFPMRPNKTKCESCDFKLLCSKKIQPFISDYVPLAINLPTSVNPNTSFIKAFSQI
ncbi:MAG TPA: PD-(D/E)XK nuclease family protein, partial [Puia sp.]|nr:PD-(D/E)XK nuclease family protein [Puia sp.]